MKTSANCELLDLDLFNFLKNSSEIRSYFLYTSLKKGSEIDIYNEMSLPGNI